MGRGRGTHSGLTYWRLQSGSHEFFQFGRDETVVRDICGKISAYFLRNGVNLKKAVDAL
jgi:hypothetical protein